MCLIQIDKMPKRYTSKDLIKIIEADGWKLEDVRGSHHQFTHSTKKGRVTFPHPAKDMNPKIVNRIFIRAGLKGKGLT